MRDLDALRVAVLHAIIDANSHWVAAQNVLRLILDEENQAKADPKVPQMVTCSRCRGYGVYGVDEPQDCGTCGGSGQVEGRDSRGRFLPWVRLSGDEPG